MQNMKERNSTKLTIKDVGGFIGEKQKVTEELLIK